jgi:hypothetical protein
MRIINALLSICILLHLSVSPALAAPPGNHLNIEEVVVTVGDPDTTLEIKGWDFDFGSPLEVTLAGVPAAVSSADGVTIIATVPTSLFPAGDYLLTVSTGEGQSQNDEYDLTIGAPGLDGQDGAPGLDGQDGAPGLDGQDGAPGLDGQDGAPGVNGAPGTDGEDGTSCSATQNDGSATINCTDGSSAELFDGADGDTGPIGPRGAPGGLQGYEFVSSGNVEILPGGLLATAEATCPVGKVALGGGYRDLGNVLFEPALPVFANGPNLSNPEREWRVVFKPHPTESRAVQVFVICANRS